MEFTNEEKKILDKVEKIDINILIKRKSSFKMVLVIMIFGLIINLFLLNLNSAYTYKVKPLNLWTWLWLAAAAFMGDQFLNYLLIMKKLIIKLKELDKSSKILSQK